MKKVLFIVLCLLLMCGCEEEELLIDNYKDIDLVPEVKSPSYVDSNNTPIGLYKLEGDKLAKIHTINTDLVIEKDIGTFQIYPSNEEVVYLNKSFGESFHDEWIKYNTSNNIKIGFNISYVLDNDEVTSYNIFSPNETFNNWEHLMNYLYDDYANLGKGFYSHIENDEYRDSTLFTAFKMQSSYSCGEIKSIELKVFTYDSDDDFLNDNYRGNSSYTMKICVNGKTCS